MSLNEYVEKNGLRVTPLLVSPTRKPDQEAEVAVFKHPTHGEELNNLTRVCRNEHTVIAVDLNTVAVIRKDDLGKVIGLMEVVSKVGEYISESDKNPEGVREKGKKPSSRSQKQSTTPKKKSAAKKTAAKKKTTARKKTATRTPAKKVAAKKKTASTKSSSANKKA